MQGWIKSAFLNPEEFPRLRPNGLHDGVAMSGARVEGGEDEEVEGAREELVAAFFHKTLMGRIERLAEDVKGCREYDVEKAREQMSLRINSEAPNFVAQTTKGEIDFHQFIGDGWAILFSHPKDFTPVCTTELGYMAKLEPEFTKRNCKLIGLSVDPVTRHGEWAQDIEETQGYKVNYPMIGDPELKVAKLYNMLPEDAGETSEGRTAANNATVRTVFVVGPDKKIKLMLVYPMTTGRNFDEILRVLDSMQLTASHKVATPVNWKNGDDVIIVPSVSDEEAKATYPGGFKTLKPYLRVVAQPK